MTNIELTAVYDRERFRFANPDGDVLISGVILEDESLSAAKGPDLAVGFQCGAAYRFFGAWTEYTNKRSGETEKQFSYKTCVKCAPLGRHGIIKYLQTAPGIGPATAKRLWDIYQSDAVKELRENPEVCSCRVPRLDVHVAEKAAEFLQREFAREACVIDLLNLLDGQGFPKTTTRKCIDKWGNAAANFIRKNPYLLMQFRGIGFKRCDQLYAHLGLPLAALKRQALCVWHGIAQAHSQNGDTWVPREEAVKSLRYSIGGADVRVQDAINLAIRGGILRSKWTDGAGVIDWDGTSCWLSDARKARSEYLVARFVVEAIRDQTPLHSITIDDSFSKHQSEKTDWLIKQPGCLKLLGGGPGSGKTWCVAKIAQQVIDKFGLDKIALAAPTGKAAVRITEAMQSHGIPLVARTWHSLLGVKSMSEGDGWGFAHGSDYPLPFRVVIGDESSMLDTTLAANVFAARQAGTLFLLSGDVHQLPPVGHGAPLRDMIAAGVPYAELVEIRRNSGEIVEQCRRIREEGQIEFRSVAHHDGNCFDRTEGDSNLILAAAHRPDQQIRLMLQTVDYASGVQFDPVWDCQVLTPTNKSGDLGRRNLNKILQAQLNPSPEIKGSVFRLGDKVVCLKNSWCAVVEASEDVDRNENNQVYVANGDLGVVRECEAKWMVVELQNPFRMVRIGRGAAREDDEHKNDGDTLDKEDEDAGTGCSWDLAYALSVHKAQGSETPVAIVMLDAGAGARRLCDAAWLYTAISRAKRYCVCIGLEGTARDMVRRKKMDRRKTFLTQLIKG